MPKVLFGVTVAMTAQAFLRDQMTALVDRGWDVHLACSPDDGTDSFQRLTDLRGVTLHPLAMARPPHPVRDARSFIAWLQLVRRLKPDIVVASTPKAGLLGTLAAKMRRVPARIYHVRGLRAEGLSGPLATISRASERIATHSATEVLVDSPSLLAVMHGNGLLPGDKGVVLGAGSCCGVDTDWFRPPTEDEREDARAAFGLKQNVVVVGFVGRLAVDKGIRELVTATEQAHEIDPRIRLLLVGPAEDDQALKNTMAKVHAASWALAPGRTADPRSIYWALDILCLPSYREGFPISPLEAQACALPVITTNATGCIDSIEPGVTGRVIPARNTSALTQAIAELTRDGLQRTAMGERARVRTEAEFDQRIVRGHVVRFVEGQALASGLAREADE